MPIKLPYQESLICFTMLSGVNFRNECLNGDFLITTAQPNSNDVSLTCRCCGTVYTQEQLIKINREKKRI